MKNLSIRGVLMLWVGVSTLLLLLMLLISEITASAQTELAKRQTERYTSYLLADELRQSSDDLTRLARTYVVSGGQPEYEKQYLDILDIRNGKKPRPAEYHRIYWDFVSAGQDKPRSDTTTESLLSLMKKAGFTADEFAKLDQAAANSNELVQTEVKAMNAVKGRYDDGKGNYTLVKAPDFELARTLMHSRDYHAFKAKIMAPIDEFFVLLDARTGQAVANGLARVDTLKTWLLVAEIIAIAFAIIFGWLLYAKIVPPLRRICDISHRMAQGQFDLIGIEGKDELGQMTSRLYSLQTAVKAMVEDAQMLAAAAVAGELATRADASKHEGEFKRVVVGMNNTLDSVIHPLKMTASYVAQISKGAIPAKITDSYNGDFNALKNNLNVCIDAVNALVADSAAMAHLKSR